MRRRSDEGGRAWRALGCLWLAGLPACVSSSIAGDVRDVRALTRVEQLPRLAKGDVDPVAAREAARLLAAPLDAEGAVRVALLENRELRARLRSEWNEPVLWPIFLLFGLAAAVIAPGIVTFYKERQ